MNLPLIRIRRLHSVLDGESELTWRGRSHEGDSISSPTSFNLVIDPESSVSRCFSSRRTLEVFFFGWVDGTQGGATLGYLTVLAGLEPPLHCITRVSPKR